MAAKLRALVRAHTGAEPAAIETERLPVATAAVEASGATWVLLEHEPLEALGGALLWLHREGRWREGRVVVPAAGEVEAVGYRLAAFAEPPSLWKAADAQLTPAGPPSLAEAAWVVAPSRPYDREALLTRLADPAHRDAVRTLLERVRESFPALAPDPLPDGVALTYRGLEVARLTVLPEGAAFEVGVGVHDQDIRRQVVGGRLVTEESLEADLRDLADALRVVEAHRRPDAPPHPLRRLRRSRWLRESVIADPASVGLVRGLPLVPVTGPQPPGSLRRDDPAVAVGPGEVVVCSAGIELEAVPAAGHAWLQAAGREPAGDAPRLTLVVTSRDLHPATAELLGRLHPSVRARLATVSPPWDRPERW